MHALLEYLDATTSSLQECSNLDRFANCGRIAFGELVRHTEFFLDGLLIRTSDPAGRGGNQSSEEVRWRLAEVDSGQYNMRKKQLTRSAISISSVLTRFAGRPEFGSEDGSSVRAFDLHSILSVYPKNDNDKY